MRRRSGGLHSDNEEAFIKLAIFAQKVGQKSDDLALFNEKGEGRNSAKEISYIENIDFDFKREACSDGDQETGSNSSGSEDSELCNKNVKCMVVGCQNTGHSEIIGKFLDEKPHDFSPDSSLEMVSQTRKENNSSVRYRIWIRNLNQERFHAIIKVYYKIVGFFIFTYDVKRRETFEKLASELEIIQKDLQTENMKGMLLGYFDEKVEGEREVLKEEGVEMSKKFNLESFDEISNTNTESFAKIWAALSAQVRSPSKSCVDAVYNKTVHSSFPPGIKWDQQRQEPLKWAAKCFATSLSVARVNL